MSELELLNYEGLHL